MNTLFRIRILFPILAVLLVAGCAKPKQGPPLPSVTIGVAEFTQPQSTADMLAGYMADNTPPVSSKTLLELSEALAEVLVKETRRPYASAQTYLECRDSQPRGEGRSRVAAMRYWLAVGNCMDVDFLLVPQVMEFYERDGGDAGVTRPASVTLNFFLLDVRNASLTGRSHFEETQMALSDNLLDTPKFLSRGGRWLTGVELAKEGMQKAVKDFGL